MHWPGGEGVTRESAKLLCAGSSPAQASDVIDYRGTVRRGDGMVDIGDLKSPDSNVVRVRVPLPVLKLLA